MLRSLVLLTTLLMATQSQAKGPEKLGNYIHIVPKGVDYSFTLSSLPN